VGKLYNFPILLESDKRLDLRQFGPISAPVRTTTRTGVLAKPVLAPKAENKVEMPQIFRLRDFQNQAIIQPA
jgi:hypothetical protein